MNSIIDRIDKILESFDTKVDIKTINVSDEYYESKFNVNNKKYTFTANYEKGSTIWVIDFYLGDNYEDSITGTGDQMKVFSGVLKAFEIFLNKVKPNDFCFFAKEKSRQKLYDRFTKHIVNKIKGNVNVKIKGKTENLKYKIIKVSHPEYLFPQFNSISDKGYFFSVVRYRGI